LNRFFSSAIFIIIISLPVLAQTEFYSRGSFDVTDLSSWSSTPDGTGPSPSQFTVDGLVFYVQANHSMTASANWVVGDLGIDTVTNVVIKSDGTITSGNFNHEVNLSMESGAKWVQTGDTYSSMKINYLNPQSIFQIDNATSFIGGRSYGTLILNGVDIAVPSYFYTRVAGDFQLINGATFSCSTSHNFQILQDIEISEESLWDISNAN